MWSINREIKQKSLSSKTRVIAYVANTHDLDLCFELKSSEVVENIAKWFALPCVHSCAWFLLRT